MKYFGNSWTENCVPIQEGKSIRQHLRKTEEVGIKTT